MLIMVCLFDFISLGEDVCHGSILCEQAAKRIVGLGSDSTNGGSVGQISGLFTQVVEIDTGNL